MKLIQKSKRQVGYLIRRDIKDSWIKAQCGAVPFINNGPEYLWPSFSRQACTSLTVGWEHLSEVRASLTQHVNEAKTIGIDVYKQFDYKIVKIIVSEEDIG